MKNPSPREAPLKVLLYRDNAKTSRHVYAEVRDDGDLCINGHDCGNDVLKFFGELDYEFFLTVKKENKERVFNALLEHCEKVGIPTDVTGNRDLALLILLERVYKGRFSAFDEFREFLKLKGIPAKFSSYV